MERAIGNVRIATTFERCGLGTTWHSCGGHTARHWRHTFILGTKCAHFRNNTGQHPTEGSLECNETWRRNVSNAENPIGRHYWEYEPRYLHQLQREIANLPQYHRRIGQRSWHWHFRFNTHWFSAVSVFGFRCAHCYQMPKLNTPQQLQNNCRKIDKISG